MVGPYAILLKTRVVAPQLAQPVVQHRVHNAPACAVLLGYRHGSHRVVGHHLQGEVELHRSQVRGARWGGPKVKGALPVISFGSTDLGFFRHKRRTSKKLGHHVVLEHLPLHEDLGLLLCERDVVCKVFAGHADSSLQHLAHARRALPQRLPSGRSHLHFLLAQHDCLVDPAQQPPRLLVFEGNGLQLDVYVRHEPEQHLTVVQHLAGHVEAQLPQKRDEVSDRSPLMLRGARTLEPVRLRELEEEVGDERDVHVAYAHGVHLLPRAIERQQREPVDEAALGHGDVGVGGERHGNEHVEEDHLHQQHEGEHEGERRVRAAVARLHAAVRGLHRQLVHDGVVALPSRTPEESDHGQGEVLKVGVLVEVLAVHDVAEEVDARDGVHHQHQKQHPSGLHDARQRHHQRRHQHAEPLEGVQDAEDAHKAHDAHGGEGGARKEERHARGDKVEPVPHGVEVPRPEPSQLHHDLHRKEDVRNHVENLRGLGHLPGLLVVLHARHQEGEQDEQVHHHLHGGGTGYFVEPGAQPVLGARHVDKGLELHQLLLGVQPLLARPGGGPIPLLVLHLEGVESVHDDSHKQVDDEEAEHQHHQHKVQSVHRRAVAV
mmetsp:Transcript_47309/g.90302  ORF Transcript_47309/g.90302 Transcript_47309/m.90302 type:complete len:603 (-) Transcript_47309:975-2783(-)